MVSFLVIVGAGNIKFSFVSVGSFSFFSCMLIVPHVHKRMVSLPGVLPEKSIARHTRDTIPR